MKKVTVLSSSGVKRAKRRIRIPIFYLIVSLAMCVLVFLFKEKTSPIKYIENSTGVERLFYLNQDDELVYLKQEFPWSIYSEPISKEDFLRDYSTSWKMGSRSNTNFLVLCVMYGLLLVLMVLLVSSDVIAVIRTRKVDRIISITE